jgi:ABC-2 type transport system ATP-binding protein
MIEVQALSKRYRSRPAVDGLTFTVRPGTVTGFLGPNGAGKSTTMRMILGLDHPCAGEARIAGRRYAELKHPLRTVGALMDASWVHPKRSARSHLRWIARSNGLPAARVEEVLSAVGLTSVAGRRTATFSYGMSQRLGIAAALLGDPAVLLFDEPVNGLDPEGIRWFRMLVQALAAEGRTVLVSSHLLAEIALTATELVVIGRGRLVAQGSIADLVSGSTGATVQVRAPRLDALAAVLRAGGLPVSKVPGEAAIRVAATTAEQVGAIAAANGLVLYELTSRDASLEEAFMELTGQDVEYVSGVTA